MLKIRLMRIGAKKRPFYRVVVIDERSKRSGQYLENLGTYNPLTEPHEINLKQDRIDYWVKQGAKASDGYLRMTGKAPQRPARKPKKEKSSVVSPQPSEEPKKEEAGEEQPVEGGATEAKVEQTESIDEPVPQEEKPDEGSA